LYQCHPPCTPSLGTIRRSTIHDRPGASHPSRSATEAQGALRHDRCREIHAPSEHDRLGYQKRPGVTVVDPHGALVEDILDHHIPKHRTNDVIYFSPKRSDRAMGLNVLEAIRPEQRALVVSQVVSIFKRLWGDSWGPRLENILRNCSRS
jgi:hypothetical protein